MANANTANYEIRVAARGSVMMPGGYLLAPGKVIPKGSLNRTQLEELLKTGYAEAVNLDALSMPQIVSDVIPGAAKPIPAPTLYDTTDPDASKHRTKILETGGGIGRALVEPSAVIGSPPTEPITVTGTGVGAQTAATTQPPPPTPNQSSIWNLNPEDLRGKSLEVLNAMIAERDATQTPFDNGEDAIAFLSMDYKAPAP